MKNGDAIKQSTASVQTTNSIDVSRFVALGDSITSGYSDGALYFEAQQNSYANLLAGQFKLKGGGNFRQALMHPSSHGIGFYGNARLVLKNKRDQSALNGLCVSYLAPQGDLSAFSSNLYASEGPFHNLGVPGAKAITLLMPGYGNPENGAGNYNPFFTRMASDPSSASILSDALALDPTFFTLFIGSNDVLAYALSAGTIDDVTPAQGEPGFGFDSSIQLTVCALKEKGARGAVANLPGITSIPYFTTIPYDGLDLDPTMAAALSMRYNQAGIKFKEGRNRFVMEDESAFPFRLRQIEKNELIFLDLLLDPQADKILTGFSPIPSKYILKVPQIEKINAALKSYNQTLESVAREKELAFVDIHSLMRSSKTDRVYDPQRLNVNYKTKGIFSLDGVHLSPLGQAVLANEFIKAINTTYNSSVAKLNLARFRGIHLPSAKGG
jgi:lysophospholipase L1-like esterase